MKVKRQGDLKGDLAAFSRKYAVLIVLAIILTNAAAFAFTHFEGPSEYGDDPNYLFLAYSVINGTYNVNPHYIFSLRPMSFLPITLIYLVLGVNGFTSSLWNILSYMGSIVVVFLAVRLLYNRKAALLSAFVFSIYPLATKFAVNVGEDMGLTFIASLAVLFFLYARKGNNRWYYLASGVFLVFTWLVSYEGAVVILFVLLYALFLLYRKSIRIDRNTLFFVYGIAMAFLVVFIISAANSGHPFATITGNLGFYSNVGVLNATSVTIPTTNDNLMFYVNGMFQYHMLSTLFAGGSVAANLNNAANVLFSHGPSDYGILYYVVVPILVLLLVLRERRAFTFIAWFAVVTLFLEFGPMSMHIVHTANSGFGIVYNNIGYVISIGHTSIVYVLAYRLLRFMLVGGVPMAAIIGIGFAKMLEVKNRYLLALDVAVIAFILAVMFANNYVIEHFWYNWQHYPESIVSQVGNYLRYNTPVGSQIYLENVLGEAYSASTLPTYLGNPDTRLVNFNVNASTPCSSFSSNSYVIWSATATCPDWQLVYTVVMPSNIPQYVISGETPELPYLPKYIYHVG